MALNPIIPLAGAGALAFLFFGKKSSAAAPPGTPEGQGAPAAATKPPAPRPTSELSDAQRERMAEALGKLGVNPGTGQLTGAADAEAIRFGSQVVGELEAAGFKDAAQALRSYVDQAAKGVKTPVEANPIAQAATGVMTKEQADYIARVLSMERDPQKIALLIQMLKALPPSPQRDNFIQMAQALALQLEAANATASTLDKIQQVIDSEPDDPDDEEVYTSTSPGLPTGKPPAAGTPVKPAQPLPEKPQAVPSQPVPQTPPSQLSEIEMVGRAMLTNLFAAQQKYGIKGAKGKEDKALVKKFQSLAGLTADGNAGPATLIMLATKGAIQLPYVYYWPKTATAATVAEYRNALEKIAQKIEASGKRDNANTLRVSIAREHGEGGINGPLFGAPAAAVTQPAPAAPKPAAPTNVVPIRTASSSSVPDHIRTIMDPAPNARVMKRGVPKGDDVKLWQTRLVQAGYGSIVGTPDGIFGGGTDAATRAFQNKMGLVPPDGQVGPNTRRAAVYAKIWPPAQV